MSDAITTTPPPTWRDAIKDEALRNDPNIATVPDLDTFAKNFIATKAMTGRKAYDLPAPDWTTEKWKEWNKTIGVPEAPDKYSPVDTTALAKAGLPKDVISAAVAKFHEVGLTDRQAKGLLDWYLGDSAKGREIQSQQEVASKTAGESSLKQHFGDKYEAKMGLVKAWMTKNADPKFAEAVDKAGLGNDPEFVKALIKSAEATLEDVSRTGNPGQGFGSPHADAASALLAIDQMKGDKAEMQKYFAGDKAMVEKWQTLHNKAYAPKAA